MFLTLMERELQCTGKISLKIPVCVAVIHPQPKNSMRWLIILIRIFEGVIYFSYEKRGYFLI